MSSTHALTLSQVWSMSSERFDRPCPPLVQAGMINDPVEQRIGTERLLIPIGRNGGSAGSIQYVVRRSKLSGTIEACLLHVEEPSDPWKRSNAVRPETTFHDRVERILAHASRPFIEHRIPYAAYLRSGDVVFSILDAAEELECQEIVVPLPCPGWRRLFSNDVVGALLARQRDIPIVAVADNGNGGFGTLRETMTNHRRK